MKKQLYMNEKVWRAATLLNQMKVDHSFAELQLTMILIFILYLVSTYSVMAALIIAIVLAAGMALSIYSDYLTRRAFTSSLPSDAEFEGN